MIGLAPALPVAWWEPVWGTVMVLGLLCVAALIYDLAKRGRGDDHPKAPWEQD